MNIQKKERKLIPEMVLLLVGAISMYLGMSHGKDLAAKVLFLNIREPETNFLIYTAFTFGLTFLGISLITVAVVFILITLRIDNN